MNNIFSSKSVTFIAGLAVIASLFLSCSKDEDKLSISSDNVITGDIENVTTTSADVYGSYNFYSAVGSILESMQLNYSGAAMVDTATIKSMLIDTPDYTFPKECGDSAMIFYEPVDVEFVSAGLVYSENSDFYDCKELAMGRLRILAFAETLSDLKPSTQYYYKTFISYNVIYRIVNEELSIDKNIDYEVQRYYVYGDTKSFTTLSK